MPDELEFDEVIDDLESFEHEGATHLTPRDYGQLRGVSPQRVYYFIRKGKLTKERCQCGREVVNVRAADECFRTFARITPRGLDGQAEGGDVVQDVPEVPPAGSD